jgi:hypothetical protein
MTGHGYIRYAGAQFHCECGHELLMLHSAMNADSHSTTEFVAQLHRAHVESLPKYLYGFDGDETLEDYPEAVYERWADDYDYRPNDMLGHDWGRPDRLLIEEWTAGPGDEFLPTADRVLDWMAEYFGNECMFDAAAEDIAEATEDPEVVAAMEQMRKLILSKTKFSFAQTKVRDLIVTWDDDGQPLLDGEPMYRPAKEAS